mmetsp:Transcript_8763/g.26578  ORF Transcript_8763/g.26578 Transcript_8763/m.26578 type:complete len:221 (+) Transcript_8763:2444-3106(+)
MSVPHVYLPPPPCFFGAPVPFPARLLRSPTPLAFAWILAMVAVSAALAASAASSAARCSSLRKLPIDPAVFAALMACAGLLLFLLRTLPNRPEGAGQGPFEQRGGGGELPDASAADRSRSWADAAPPRRSSLRHKRTRCSATLSNSGRARRRAVRACGRSGRCRDAEGGEVLLSVEAARAEAVLGVGAAQAEAVLSTHHVARRNTRGCIVAECAHCVGRR